MNGSSSHSQRILFLRNLSLTAGGLLATFAVLFLFVPCPDTTRLVLSLGSISYLAGYRFADRPWLPHAILVLSWSLIASFDAGFSGEPAVWLFLIPTTLFGWIVYDRMRMRLVVAVVPVAILVITNLGSPLLPLPSMPHALHLALHFMAAISASVLCVAHLLSSEALARSELLSSREEAERASRAKDEFLSHMSHEFRTPLNAIHGFTDLLLGQYRDHLKEGNQNLRQDCNDNLTAIQTATEHLTHIVEDILDLSRLESGQIRLQAKPFQPETILGDVKSSLAARVLERNLAMEIHLDTPLPRLVGDKVRWKQILLNLAGNAVKFSSQGVIRLAAEYQESPHGKGVLQVRITDEGQGIPQNLQEKVFDRFIRADAVERAETAGTGLGLPISRNLARAMGGDVVLEHSSPAGSTFLLSIPFPRAQETDFESGIYQRIRPFPLRGRHVLLCEDNRLNIRLATKLLEKMECTWDVAEDGGQAIESLRARSYDLVLLDLHMPVADGFDVARSVRTDPSHRNHATPMIALTADAFEETRLRTREVGIDEFLAKPYTFENLQSKILLVLSPEGARR